MTRNPVLPRFLAAVLASAVLVEPAGAAGAKLKAAEKPLAAVDLPPCAVAYHASLQRIAADDLAAFRGTPVIPATPADAGGASRQADASLPGMPIFVPPSRKRSAAEIEALTAAVALARSRGRSTSVASAGSEGGRTWIAARLREDLGDYLNQKPTPYLCSGVPAYLETLRRFALRLGPVGDRKPEWIATQRLAAEGSVKAAADIVAQARAGAAQTVAETNLRGGAELSRSETPAPAPEPKIENEAAILAAIDRLVADARAAGLVAEPPMPQVTGATAAPAPVPARPVLAKLVAARPLVMSARPLVHDRNARLKLLAAFADLEMLDYLQHATTEAPDPVAAAIGKTLDDIAKAQKTDCTCAN